MSWRVAASLIALRTEVDTFAPNRDRSTDGTIGDARHRANPSSQHNPNSHGVVCALDLTHDPAHGVDVGRLAEYLRTHPHPAAWYLIFNRRIASITYGWKWRPYGGASPHTEHLHVSVRGAYDDRTPWRAAAALTRAPAAAKPVRATGTSRPTVRAGSTGTHVRLVQRFLGLTVDGRFGPKTHAAVVRYQTMRGLTPDGIVGAITWRNISSVL